MTITLTLKFKKGTDKSEARAAAAAIAMDLMHDLKDAGQEVFGDACPTSVKIGRLEVAK